MSYDPTLQLDLAETVLTFGNNNLHWAYVVVTVTVDTETGVQTESATIEASESHIDPMQYWESDGKIHYKIGWFNPVVEGNREAYMLWNNYKQEHSGILVNQPAHSFIFGNTIKRDGITGLWILSKADTRANAGTVGIVCEIIDADHFRYIAGGLLKAPGQFVDGADYFLSPTTAGAIFIQSDPEVWSVGQIREFIGTGTFDGLEIEIDAGEEITEMAWDNETDWISFDYRDIEGGVAAIYPLDIDASIKYNIVSAVFRTNDGTLQATIRINGTPVTGLSAVAVNTVKAKTMATANNAVVEGNEVQLYVGTPFTGLPTVIHGKITIQRL